MTDVVDVVEAASAVAGLSTEELAAELLARSDGDAMRLVGPGGLLSGLTKRVLESALEAEMAEHLGYEPYDPAGHNSGNSIVVRETRSSASPSSFQAIPQVAVDSRADKDHRPS